MLLPRGRGAAPGLVRLQGPGVTGRVSREDAGRRDTARPRAPASGPSQASVGSLQATLSESWAVSVGLSLTRRKQLLSTITTMTSQTLAR